MKVLFILIFLGLLFWQYSYSQGKIYTHSNDSLFVNLFIVSELNRRNKKIKMKQETKFPYEEKTKLIITEGASLFSLMTKSL